MLIYTFLKQLTLCTVEFRIKSDSGFRPFEIEFVFVDQGKMICDVVIDPIQQDPRTGEWSFAATIGTSFGLRLSADLRNSIREYTKELTRELSEMLMEDFK